MIYSLSGRAYELYKIDWVRTYITAEVEKKTMQEYFDYMKECIEVGDHIDDYDEWIFENGYANGMMYVCYEDFFDEDFRDKYYMKQLLSEPDFDLWQQYYKEEN